jgi:hypothetical protein
MSRRAQYERRLERLPARFPGATPEPDQARVQGPLPAKQFGARLRRTSVVSACLIISVVARGRTCASRIAPQRQPRTVRSVDSRCAACGGGSTMKLSPGHRGHHTTPSQCWCQSAARCCELACCLSRPGGSIGIKQAVETLTETNSPARPASRRRRLES